MTSTNLAEEQKQDRMGMDTSRSTIDSIHQHKQMRRMVEDQNNKILNVHRKRTLRGLPPLMTRACPV